MFRVPVRRTVASSFGRSLGRIHESPRAKEWSGFWRVGRDPEVRESCVDTDCIVLVMHGIQLECPELEQLQLELSAQ